MNAVTGQPDLLRSGIFTVPEAAELVGAPKAVVRLWIKGQKGRQNPVIENQLGLVDGKAAVSFTNLMELRFVARFHNAGVRLNEIRAIMDEAKNLLQHPHPTATRIVFRTDGRKIIAAIGQKHGVEHAERLYDLRSRNYEMPTVVVPSLKEDVIFDPQGNMIAWFPRKEIAPNVIVHPYFSFGRPILKKSHIPAETLADAVKAEGSVRTVAQLYEVPEGQVKEALRFQENLHLAA